MTDPVVSDAVRAEILGKLARFRLGLEKSAIHEMLTVSTSMEETLAALCRLRKDGKVESDDAGRYYLHSTSNQKVSNGERRGVVKPSEEGRLPVSRSTPTAAAARHAPAVAVRMTDRARAAARPKGDRPRHTSGLPWGGVRRQLIVSLSRPMNARQLAAASKLTPKQVNNHLFFLRRDGLVDGVLAGSGAKKIWSRTPAGEKFVKGIAAAPKAAR